MVINGSNGVTDADICLQSILNQIKGDCRPGIFLRKVKETGPEAARRAGGGCGSYTGSDWMEGVVSDPRPFIKSNIHAMQLKHFSIIGQTTRPPVNQTTHLPPSPGR